jgi:hypothetical protein
MTHGSTHLQVRIPAALDRRSRATEADSTAAGATIEGVQWPGVSAYPGALWPGVSATVGGVQETGDFGLQAFLAASAAAAIGSADSAAVGPASAGASAGHDGVDWTRGPGTWGRLQPLLGLLTTPQRLLALTGGQTRGMRVRSREQAMTSALRGRWQSPPGLEGAVLTDRLRPMGRRADVYIFRWVRHLVLDSGLATAFDAPSIHASAAARHSDADVTTDGFPLQEPLRDQAPAGCGAEVLLPSAADDQAGIAQAPAAALGTATAARSTTRATVPVGGSSSLAPHRSTTAGLNEGLEQQHTRAAECAASRASFLYAFARVVAPSLALLQLLDGQLVRLLALVGLQEPGTVPAGNPVSFVGTDTPFTQDTAGLLPEEWEEVRHSLRDALPASRRLLEDRLKSLLGTQRNSDIATRSKGDSAGAFTDLHACIGPVLAQRPWASWKLVLQPAGALGSRTEGRGAAAAALPSSPSHTLTFDPEGAAITFRLVRTAPLLRGGAAAGGSSAPPSTQASATVECLGESPMIKGAGNAASGAGATTSPALAASASSMLLSAAAAMPDALPGRLESVAAEAQEDVATGHVRLLQQLIAAATDAYRVARRRIVPAMRQVAVLAGLQIQPGWRAAGEASLRAATALLSLPAGERRAATHCSHTARMPTSWREGVIAAALALPADAADLLLPRYTIAVADPGVPAWSSAHAWGAAGTEALQQSSRGRRWRARNREHQQAARHGAAAGAVMAGAGGRAPERARAFAAGGPRRTTGAPRAGQGSGMRAAAGAGAATGAPARAGSGPGLPYVNPAAGADAASHTQQRAEH